MIDYLPRDDRMPEGLAFIFDGGTITDAQVDDLSLTDPENLSAGLFSLDEAVTKVKPSLTRRLAVALEVAQDGGRRRVVNSSLPRARRAGSLWCGARGRRSDSGSIAKPRH